MVTQYNPSNEKITVILRTVDHMYQICPEGSVIITSKEYSKMLHLKNLLKWFGIACKAGW
jgi:hypothetical protein